MLYIYVIDSKFQSKYLNSIECKHRATSLFIFFSFFFNFILFLNFT